MFSIILGTITMAAALRLAVPLILSSVGGCFGDRTGIFNIALESFMLCAAFFATLGTYYTGNPYVGVACGILAGLGCSVIFGVLVFYMGSSGMVVSIAMNLGMDAFTSFLLLNVFGKRGSFMDPKLVSLPVIRLPLIEKIPYIGEILSGHNLVVYFSLLAVAAIMIAKGNPALAALYSFLFAYAEALAASMQNFGIPSQIVLALPYFMTIAILLISGIRAKIKNPSYEAA